MCRILWLVLSSTLVACVGAPFTVAEATSDSSPADSGALLPLTTLIDAGSDVESLPAPSPAPLGEAAADAVDASSDAPPPSLDSGEGPAAPEAGRYLCVPADNGCTPSFPFSCSQGAECCTWRPPGC